MVNKKPSQTGGRIEVGTISPTGPARQVENPEKKELKLTKEEERKIAQDIQILSGKYDFAKLLRQKGFDVTDTDGEEFRIFVLNNMGDLQGALLSYLEEEYGTQKLKQEILGNGNLASEFFEAEMEKQTGEYYCKFLNSQNELSEKQGRNFDRMNLEKHSDVVLKSAAEVLSEAVDQKELKEKIEAAVEEKIQKIMQAMDGLDQDGLRKSGVDPDALEAEKKSFLEKEKQKIIEHCLERFQKGSEAGPLPQDPEQIVFWTNYFTNSAFSHKGDENLRKAFGKAFPKTVGGTEKSEMDNRADPNATPERLIAEHGLYSAKTPNLDEMLGKSPSKEEALQRLKENMRKFLDDFTTHGMLGPPDPETGERQILPRSDLDGQACVLLLKKAGFNLDKLKYVKQGEEPESGWAFDITKEHGYVLKDGGRVLITNDSNKESGKDSSAKFIFEGLKNFGLLDQIGKEEMKALEKFVEFVTKEDNKDYTDHEAKQIIDHYPKNLAGLRRFLTDEDLLRVFEEQVKEKKYFNPYMALPGIYLENLSYRDPATGEPMKFEQVSKKLHNSKKYSLESISDSESKGFFIDTGDGRFGKVLIDSGRLDAQGVRRRKIGLGYDAARSEGFGAYVVFDEEGKYFSVQTVKDMDFEFGQGMEVSKRYWLFTGDRKLEVNLEEILKKLSGNPDYQMEAGLKEALEKEKKEIEETEKRVNLLFDGLKIGAIEAGMPEDISALSGEEKKKAEAKFRLLEETKTLARKIAGAVSVKDVEYFLASVLGEKNFEQYASLRDKETDPGKRERFGNVVKKASRDFLEKRGYNKDEAKQVVNLFFKITDLRFTK